VSLGHTRGLDAARAARGAGSVVCGRTCELTVLCLEPYAHPRHLGQSLIRRGLFIVTYSRNCWAASLRGCSRQRRCHCSTAPVRHLGHRQSSRPPPPVLTGHVSSLLSYKPDTSGLGAASRCSRRRGVPARVGLRRSTPTDRDKSRGYAAGGLAPERSPPPHPPYCPTSLRRGPGRTWFISHEERYTEPLMSIAACAGRRRPQPSPAPQDTARAGRRPGSWGLPPPPPPPLLVLSGHAASLTPY
jgi:hypothetical protein